MEEGLVPYGKDGKLMLKDYEAEFMKTFEETHNIDAAFKSLTPNHRANIKGKLNRGVADVAKAYKQFIESAPSHPRVNRVAILDTLVWAMEKSKEHEDTAGVIRAIQEINKMIKGNLVGGNDKNITKTNIIGLVDLTKRRAEEETVTIDVTHTEDNG